MKKNWNSYNMKFIIIILIPMVLIISYLYYDRQQSYNLYIENYEKRMANILLEEKGFINKSLESSPLILRNDEITKIRDEVHNHTSPIENLLFKLTMERLDCSAMGIFSFKRNEIVFHLGKEDVYQNIDIDKIKENNFEKKKDGFFTSYSNNLMYIYPIENGFIYTFQENLENKPNPGLFLGMFILSVFLAIASAMFVENRTQKRIYGLKVELIALKDLGEPLPNHNDNFKEIVQTVNELKDHLSSQKDLLHTILDSLPIGIVYYDQNGQVMYANNTTTQITGYSREEIKRFTLSGNILSSDETVFWETLRSGESFLGFESYCPTKDGNEIPVVTSTTPLYDPSNKLIGTISSFFDITEQDRLRKIEQRAKEMLDHISDGVMMVDNDGVISGFNRGAEEMTGLKADQVIGKKYDDIFIKRKTIFTKLTQTLMSKKEYTNYKKETTTEDGRKVYLMITTKILRDEEGQQIGAMGIYKDITHVEELSLQVQRADKLAVVGELAAGTAHEIRNPLTTIKGFIQLLKQEGIDTSKNKYIDLVLDEINHINEIIREMLLLAKPAYPSKDLVSINQLIKDIVAFMNSEAMLYNLEFKTHLEGEIPDIELDERQIKQVFINLIRNAIQAMKKGGSIDIYTSLNTEKQLIEIIFEDHGEGIKEEELARIYEPFFTTKEEGTGLGIPVSYRIVKNHNGDLQIRSMYGKGTKVILYFPINTDDSFEDRKE